ncbi:MAG: helix-turn-helix transcriptional regulator [Lachnospiraceae bacterium]|nr:helix-turn-helix transcriptional regulator [Lachnospiraceae bacterium]
MKKRKKSTGSKGNVSSLSGIYSPVKITLLSRDPSTLNVGERLRRERFLRSFTLEQMAAYLGISTSYLGSMERGVRPMSKRMIQLFHDRLNLSYDYLLDGLSVTGTMIAQYVQESSHYDDPVRHKINVLLNVATPEEQSACYNMIHTYLAQGRNRQIPQE